MHVFLEAEVRKMYKLLRHSGYGTLLHCQNVRTHKIIDRRTVNGEEEVVKWAKSFNARGNCFIGRNPRSIDGSAKPIAVSSISLDLDPVRPEGTAANDQQIKEAINCGTEIIGKFPGGSLLFSGNGVQIIYSWKPTSKLLGSELFRQQCKLWTDNLRKSLNSGQVVIDHIHDPERLIKLAGTTSTKGSEKDWKPTRFLRYNLAESTAILSEICAIITDTTKVVSELPGNLPKAAELGYTSRSEADYGLASFLHRKGYTREQTLAALQANPVGRTDRADDHERILGKLFTTNSLDKSVDQGYNDSEDVGAFLEDEQTVEWLAEPIVARKALGFVAGLPETMKTWMMIDLAVEMARGGGTWLGKFPVKGAKVLFIDQERFKGETQRRFRSVLSAKELTAPMLQDKLYLKCGTIIHLDQDTDYELFREELTRLRPDLVIVDSFATFHTKEENNRKDIQTVIERIKSLRNQVGCSFLFIDHENKSVFTDHEKEEAPSAFRMIGSVAKPAAAEVVLTVRRQDAQRSMVYHTKSTLASTVAPFMVRVRDLSPGKIVVEAI